MRIRWRMVPDDSPKGGNGVLCAKLGPVWGVTGPNCAALLSLSQCHGEAGVAKRSVPRLLFLAFANFDYRDLSAVEI